MVNQYSGNRRNLMYNNNTRNPPPAMVNQYSGNQRNPIYNNNNRNPPRVTVNQYSSNPRNPMNNNNTRIPPPAMVNQYSGNPRNFCCNNPRNRLAAPAAFNHNLQYPNSRRNIWRSYYRRNRLSNNRFTHNRILRQSFYRTNWVHCCNELNHFDGRRSRNSRPDTRVINHANRNNPRELHGTRDCGRFNHFGGRRFRNSQPYIRDLIRSDRNNPRWLDERERYHNSNQNNNSNLFHNITEHDMGQQSHDLAQDGYNESDPLPESYLEENCVNFNNDVPEEGAEYAQDGYNVNDPLPERHLAEDCVNFNDDVPEEGAEYAHADRNCRDPPLENDNIAEEDLAANQISDNGHRQEVQGDLTEEQGIPTIPSLDHQTLTEVITHQSDEEVELAESGRPILRVFRAMNTNSNPYLLYICFPVNEVIPMGHVDSWRLASLLDENAAHGLTEDNEEEAEEQVDDIQENAGLSEEEISEKLQIGLHSESANEGKMEADGLMEEQPAICVICQMQYEKEETTGSLQCGHEYHVGCIKKWLLLSNKCPICFGAV